MNDLKLIRPKELANLLSVSIPTLYRMMDDLPPKILIGKAAVGWRASDIEKFLKERTEVRGAAK